MLTRHIVFFFLLVMALSVKADLYVLNGTGGSFPEQIYGQATFNYQIVDAEAAMAYVAAGSTTGKCNVMGYWHSGNTINGLCMPTAVNSYTGLTSCNKLDTNICTDACTSTTCGPPYTQTSVVTDSSSSTKAQYGGSVVQDQRKDAAYRTPLTDYGASDAILNGGDHYYFPALQTYPAVAGPVVPIFNIPELKKFCFSTHVQLPWV